MSDACVTQLVRAVDRQSKDWGSNPGTVESVFFPRKDFKFFHNLLWREARFQTIFKVSKFKLNLKYAKIAITIYTMQLLKCTNSISKIFKHLEIE